MNQQGGLGLNQNGAPNGLDISSPTQLPGTNWSNVDGGLYHMIATKTNGTLWSWGLNSSGELGHNNKIYYSSPVQIGSSTDWATGENKIYISGHAKAIKTDGTLWSWGYNNVGSVGSNNRTEYSSPIQIPGTNWATVGGNSSSHAVATKTDGTAWSWGHNENGTLGLNQASSLNVSSPTQIPGTTWAKCGGTYNTIWLMTS